MKVDKTLGFAVVVKEGDSWQVCYNFRNGESVNCESPIVLLTSEEATASLLALRKQFPHEEYLKVKVLEPVDE